MVVYNFKTIAVVPSAKDFIDIILSKTQRKTPTVVHKGYAISRIRRFYMRKIKYTQESYHERITQILEDFPRLDDIHPFYADLINVLYSKDHYKLALGQINTAKSLIDNIGKDYLKMTKFADSLYRCKELKRAALGRMCTVMKKLGSSLEYLEQVRQHLSRLPSIDPSTRTILITGYPNVGKSSFINKVSNADVEVQPYAFTTKSLFVGHFDYKYVRWQVIDTPGILDHPLEERNSIEMQAITALAHLHATVLYFLDPSERCGYSLKQQVELFHNIRPLFSNKPLLIVANKTDLKRLSDLSAEEMALIEGMKTSRGTDDTQIIEMSNMAEVNIHHVLHTGCDMLMHRLVERKEKSTRAKEIMNRITVTRPEKPRDNKERPVAIPPSVLAARQAAAEQKAALLAMADEDGPSSSISQPLRRKTERDLELEQGGPGIYNVDLRKHYQLSNDDWKYDIVPEIMDGKNVADYVDPDIERQLAELEAEEESFIKEKEMKDGEEDDGSDLSEEEWEQVRQIRENRTLHIKEGILRKTNNKPVIPRSRRSKSIDDFAGDLEQMGIPTDKAVSRARGRDRSRSAHRGVLGKRGRDDMQDEGEGQSQTRGRRDPSVQRPGEGDLEYKLRLRSRSATRDQSVPRKASPSPFRNVKQKMQAEKISKVAQRPRNSDGRMGEADRHFYDPKPKHLFSGKRGIGKSDRR